MWDIAAALGRSSGDIGDLITTWGNDGREKWMFNKPFRNSSPGEMTDAQRFAADCGWSIPRKKSAGESVFDYAQYLRQQGDRWGYLYPRGIANGEWFRMFDFNGFNANAQPYPAKASFKFGTLIAAERAPYETFSYNHEIDSPVYVTGYGLTIRERGLMAISASVRGGGYGDCNWHLNVSIYDTTSSWVKIYDKSYSSSERTYTGQTETIRINETHDFNQPGHEFTAQVQVYIDHLYDTEEEGRPLPAGFGINVDVISLTALDFDSREGEKYTDMAIAEFEPPTVEFSRWQNFLSSKFGTTGGTLSLFYAVMPYDQLDLPLTDYYMVGHCPSASAQKDILDFPVLFEGDWHDIGRAVHHYEIILMLHDNIVPPFYDGWRECHTDTPLFLDTNLLPACQYKHMLYV